MSTKRKLERDSELYDRTMRNRVINQSDFESEFVEITGLHYQIDYECSLSWKSLNNEHTFSDISLSRLSDLRNMSPIELAKEAGKTTTSHTWKGYGDVKIQLNLYYTVTLPDSETINLRSEFELNTHNDKSNVSELIRSIESQNKTSVSISDEGMNIELENGSSFKAEKVSSYKISSSKKSNELIGYLNSESIYTSGKLGSVQHDGSRAYIPVETNGYTIEFTFDDPESNQEFWNIVEEFGSGDPMLISGSEVYITLSALNDTDSHLTDNNLFSLHAEEKSSSLNLSIGTDSGTIGRFLGTIRSYFAE